MSWVAAAVVGGTLVGGVITSSANKKAADKASDAQLQGAQIQADSLAKAQDKQLAFAREGQDELRLAREEQAPGQSYLRSVVADPGSLTPLQQQKLDEIRRSTRNQISTSSIAGSGRTAAAIIRNGESDFTNKSLEANRQRSMDAATGMANRSAQFTSGIGNISVGTGTQQANLQATQGQVLGGATTNAGTIQAQGDLANGRLAGQAFGDISSAITTANRQSRYGNVNNLSTMGWAPGPNGGDIAPTFGA